MASYMDTLFECEFALAIAQKSSYDVLDDTTLETVQNILKSSKHKSDPRLSRLSKEYQNVLGLYGYYTYIDYMDEDEIIDVCKKIYFYESNGIENKDYIYLKTFQRALLIQKNVSLMTSEMYLKYKKYHKNFEYINHWINKQV